MFRTMWRKLFARSTQSSKAIKHRNVKPQLSRMEERLAPATLTDGGTTTLTITLDNANEQLSIVSNGLTYGFDSTDKFVDGGVAKATDFAGFGTKNLTLQATGLVRYSTINVVDAKSGTSVEFNDSGANLYSDSFKVTLDDAAAGGISFNGASSFALTSSLTASTSRSILVAVGASLSAFNGDINLSANQQAAPTSGNFRGIEIDGTVSTSGTGNISLSGRGGNDATKSSHIGVVVLSGKVESAGTGKITVVGTGGIGVDQNFGVAVTGAAALISSVQGKISITGAGGDGTNGTGVFVFDGGVISSTGVGASAATIEINATGASAGAASSGFRTEDAGSGVKTVDGSITITATKTVPIEAIVLNGGTIGSTGDGEVVLMANSIALLSEINAAGAIVDIKTLDGNAVDLGGVDSATVLGLTNSELNKITALALRIDNTKVGGAGSNITISAAINPANVTTLVLATGGAIVDSVGAGPNLKVASLALVAETGIGSSTNPLATQVSNLEAQTTTGGIFISNTGDLNIGGTSDAIDGVQVTTSGDIELVNAGSIILAGTSSEDIRTTLGNVLVQANGATANVETRNDSADAIDSNNGNVTIKAGQDLLFGDATTDNFGDIEAVGNIILVAGRNIILDENTFVEAFGTGTITATAGGDISILASDGTKGSQFSTRGGTISLTTGSAGTFTITNGQSVFTNLLGGNGNITINAGDVAIAGPINAGAGIVTLQQANTTSRLISLGGGAVAGALGISDAELANITAGILRIGRTDNPGDISLDGAVTTHAGYNTLTLLTGGAIRDDNLGTDITVANLSLQAAKGIGDAGGFSILDIQVTNVAFSNLLSGAVNIADAGGGLTIAPVDQITTTSTAVKGGFISAASPLTIAMNVLAGGSMLFVAGDSLLPGDDLTIKNGVTVTLDSIINGTLSFIAGDDIVFEGTGNILTKSAAGHKVQLSADNENNILDLDGGTIAQDTAATVSVTTNILEITPRASIGTAATRFFFSADSITTTSTLGSQFLRELNGITAVALTANGIGNDIDLIVDAGDLAVGTITAADQVTLKATTGKIIDTNAGATNVTAIGLTATAATGIDLDTDVDTINANTTGAGSINLDEANGVTLTNVTTVNGPITITTGGNTSITNVVSSTDTDANDISIKVATGDTTVTTVNAGGVSGDASIEATTGSIFDDGVNATVITADVVTLTADRAIGAPGAVANIDTTANSWNLQTTGPGPFAGLPTPGIWVTDTDKVTVTSATTGDGVILLASGGTMTVGTVTAGGAGRNVRLLTTAGDIQLGVVTATADTVLLVAAGAIVDTNAGNNVTAGKLAMTAVTGIGVGNAIETTVTELAATSTAGNIEVANSITLTVSEVAAFGTTVTGIKTPDDVILSTDELAVTKVISGDCVIIQTNSDNTVNARLGANAAGELSLDQAELDLITANILQFGGSLAGTNRSKSVVVAAPINVTTSPTLDIRTAGTISDNAGAGTIKVNNLAFAAGDTVTLNGNNDVNVLAGTTTKGDILFRDSDDLSVNTVTVCDGVVNQLTAPGKIMVTANGPNISVKIDGDCVIFDTIAAGPIDLGVDLTDAELDLVIARVLQIGNTNASAINISAPISINSLKVDNVHLLAQTNVTTTTGTISTGKLAVDAVTGISLTGGNDLATFAGKVTGVGADVVIEDSNNLTVGTVQLCDMTNRDGITADDDITINADGFLDIAKATTTGDQITLTSRQLDINDKLEGKSISLLAEVNLIDLGTDDSAGVYGLTQTEIDFLKASSGIVISQQDTANVQVSKAVTFDDTPLTVNSTGGSIKTVGGGLKVDQLNVTAVNGGVSLTGSNDVKLLDGRAKTDFIYNDVSDYQVGSALGTGVQSANGSVQFSGGDTITTNGFPITAKTFVSFNTVKGGVTNSADLKAPGLELLGKGTFNFGTFIDVDTVAANVDGFVLIFDSDDLAVGKVNATSNIKTNNNNLAIRTRRGFNLSKDFSIDLGTGSGEILTGLGDVGKGPSDYTSTLLGGLNANAVTGITLKGNIQSNNFQLNPSPTTPIFLYGDFPTPAEVTPAIPGDALGTVGVPGAVITLVYDQATGNGSIDYGGVRQKITFFSIERILGLGIQAVVTQVADFVSAVQAVGTLNGQALKGGLSAQPPVNPPFLVAPSFVDPTQPYKAPSLAIGDVDGDGMPDIIVGAGPNSGGPLVTVISGQRVLIAANANAPLNQFTLAQFFAYDPAFQGGVFVAAADILPDPMGKRVEIITGAGQNGGPHVAMFQLTGTANPAQNKQLTVTKGPQFFAYAAGFRGGVRVSAGDVNGDDVPDIVTGAGPGGGPHVRVIDGKSLQANAIVQAAEFFAFDPSFRGGVYVDVGDVAKGVNDFVPDGFAEIAVGAGYGGGPHIKIIDGKRLTQAGPAVQTDFEFFDAPFINPSVPTPFEEGVFTLSAGVSGVGFGDFDGDGNLDLFVGSGLGRKSRFRIYRMGNPNAINANAGNNFLGDKVANSDLNYGVYVATSAANLGS